MPSPPSRTGWASTRRPARWTRSRAGHRARAGSVRIGQAVQARSHAAMSPHSASVANAQPRAVPATRPVHTFAPSRTATASEPAAQDEARDHVVAPGVEGVPERHGPAAGDPRRHPEEPGGRQRDDGEREDPERHEDRDDDRDDRGHRPDEVRRDEPPRVVVEVRERLPDGAAQRRHGDGRQAAAARRARPGRQPLTPLAAIPSTK